MVGALIVVGFILLIFGIGLWHDRLKQRRATRHSREWKKFECHHKALDEELQRHWEHLNN
jgi:hypothetical protein